MWGITNRTNIWVIFPSPCPQCQTFFDVEFSVVEVMEGVGQIEGALARVLLFGFLRGVS